MRLTAPLTAVWLAFAMGTILARAEAAQTTAVASPALELRSKGKVLGQIASIVDDGEAFVSAERLAALLNGAWTTRGIRGSLTVGSRSAHFTRETTSVVVERQVIGLGARPRIGPSGWLVPEEFLAVGLARLVPGVSAVRLVAAKPPAPLPRRAEGAITERAVTGRHHAASAADLRVRREPQINPVASAERPVGFEELRYRSYPSFTRIVIEATAPIAALVEPGVQNVLVRLPRVALPSPRAEAVDDGLVKQLRLESAGADAVLRIALAGPAAEVKTLSLEDPYRLVVDVHRPRMVREAEARRASGQSLGLIVIDPGHGGHDPGAIGPSGLAEKDVVLDVSRRLAHMVEEGLAIKVLMTRTGDVFVPLRDRTNFANKQRADLFVSIHANAHPRSLSEGVETYFLSSEATDSEARQVAAIENGVVQLESANQRQKTDVLKSILWDLAQSEFQQESSFMAETVQDLVTRVLGLVNRGVKQAGFYVLGGAAMPAILIEVGFLTNPREEKKLASPAHREAVARAIYAGLAEYKQRYNQRMRAAQTPGARSETR